MHGNLNFADERSGGIKPDIKVGDYVKMGAYNNASILWRCVSIDNNGPLMLADKIVDTLA